VSRAYPEDPESGVRLLAGVAALSFLGVGAAFYLAPDAVAATLTDIGRGLGDFAEPSATGFRFWVGLTAAYMAVVTALALGVCWDPVGNAGLLPYLAVGKLTSSLTSLHLYVADAPAFAYLLNFLVDGAIAMVCLLCWVAMLWSAFARGRALFPGAPDPLLGRRARRAWIALLETFVPGVLGRGEWALEVFGAFLRDQHPATPRLATWAAMALEWSPLLSLRGLRPLSSLRPEAREAHLRALAESPLAPVRQVVANLRFLIVTVLYTREELATDAGYSGPEPMEAA